MLAPTLFNLFFDAVIRLAINDHHPGTGLSQYHFLNADQVGNWMKLTIEVSVSDLEYADYMALISDSCDGLTTLLESLDSKYHYMGLTIICKKSKLTCQMLMPNPIPHPPACTESSH